MKMIDRCKPMKVFISGAMTGIVNHNRLAFHMAQNYLEHYGHICMNPAVLDDGFEYDDYLNICLAMLNACDAVYVLKNSEHSKGSQREIEFAKGLGLDIFYEE